MKICKRCTQVKMESEFCKMSANKDGLNRYCRRCELVRIKEWHKKDKEYRKKFIQSVIRWQKRNPEKVKKSQARYRKRNRKKIL